MFPPGTIRLCFESLPTQSYPHVTCTYLSGSWIPQLECGAGWKAATRQFEQAKRMDSISQAVLSVMCCRFVCLKFISDVSVSDRLVLTYINSSTHAVDAPTYIDFYTVGYSF